MTRSRECFNRTTKRFRETYTAGQRRSKLLILDDRDSPRNVVNWNSSKSRERDHNLASWSSAIYDEGKRKKETRENFSSGYRVTALWRYETNLNKSNAAEPGIVIVVKWKFWIQSRPIKIAGRFFESAYRYDGICELALYVISLVSLLNK